MEPWWDGGQRQRRLASRRVSQWGFPETCSRMCCTDTAGWRRKNGTAARYEEADSNSEPESAICRAWSFAIRQLLSDPDLRDAVGERQYLVENSRSRSDVETAGLTRPLLLTAEPRLSCCYFDHRHSVHFSSYPQPTINWPLVRNTLPFLHFNPFHRTKSQAKLVDIFGFTARRPRV